MSAILQRLPALAGFGIAKTKDEAPPRTLIDRLLDEQGTLQTPVARFSEIHDRGSDLAEHYRTLIPLSRPGAEEQYAFEVSLDRCTGCKACVSACHSLNGLDEGESWRDTGTILGGAKEPAWQQTVTTACHHCEDPGCMNGCPVGAYEKDAETGIVKHLDDQCIGCSYCILKCPYDVPKYSEKRGIVRKCDMCQQRLAVGEAPACVQACPTEAIRIVTVPKSRQPNLLPVDLAAKSSAVPDSRITRPTTRYTGRDIPRTAHAADRDRLTPQHAHWPLVLMLVFTQSGIGFLSGNLLTHPLSPQQPTILAGTVLFFIGMGASVFHLGQPLKAWRFFLGLRTSWLSREILAFSLFAPIPPLLCILAFLPDFGFLKLPETVSSLIPLITLATVIPAIPLALVSVFTSVMIYHDTHRSLWRFPLGAIRFFGTVASFASLSMLTLDPGIISLILFAGIVVLKISSEAIFLLKSRNSEDDWSPDQHSARLQLGPLRKILLARTLLALASIALAAFNPWLALPALLLAEVFERQLFFQSVQAPKMPGNFGPATHAFP